MAVEMDQVRAALEPEEPDYPGSAQKLGADALPYLEKIVTGDHPGLAAKAAYLAGLIGTERCMPALAKAASSGHAAVRIAAAAVAKYLPGDYRESLVGQLMDDADAGVQKVAMNSAPALEAMSDALRTRVTARRAPAAAPKAPATKAAAKKAPAKKAAAKKKP